MRLSRKIKMALGESRLLILGAQVLFGFQFNGVFQDLFETLPFLSKAIQCVGLALLVLTIGLLIAPSMRHRLVEGGEASGGALNFATRVMDWALAPFAAALALDVFIATERVGGRAWGTWLGTGAFAVALLFWYAWEFLLRKKERAVSEEARESTPLPDKVEQLLTESRVVLPGAQALLGFQLTVTLTRAFQELPLESKAAHVAALCCVALAVILLMAPAAFHRISFAGEDDPAFLRLGSAFVIAAPAPLAAAIALDTYVAVRRALDSAPTALILAACALIVLLGLWYGYPLLRRERSRGRSQRAKSGA
jgi:hypothetical protein